MHVRRRFTCTGLLSCFAVAAGCSTAQLADYRSHVHSTQRPTASADSDFSVAFGLDGVNTTALAAVRDPDVAAPPR